MHAFLGVAVHRTASCSCCTRRRHLPGRWT